MTYPEYLAIRPDYGWTEEQIQQLNGCRQSPVEANEKERHKAWRFRQWCIYKPKPVRTQAKRVKVAFWFTQAWLSFWHKYTQGMLRAKRTETAGTTVELSSLHFVKYRQSPEPRTSNAGNGRWSLYPEQQLCFSDTRDRS